MKIIRGDKVYVQNIDIALLPAVSTLGINCSGETFSQIFCQ